MNGCFLGETGVILITVRLDNVVEAFIAPLSGILACLNHTFKHWAWPWMPERQLRQRLWQTSGMRGVQGASKLAMMALLLGMSSLLSLNAARMFSH
jgi:hypothetical protein